MLAAPVDEPRPARSSLVWVASLVRPVKVWEVMVGPLPTSRG